MPRQTGRQKEIVGRVMHEFKHGELESRGRKVRNPRQAIAIGLSEAGTSRNQSPTQNKRSRARTEAKERQGRTAQQMKEGRGGAGKPRAASPSRSRGGARASGRAARSEPTRAELYAETKRRGLSGCSRLSKAELENVLRRH